VLGALSFVLDIKRHGRIRRLNKQSTEHQAQSTNYEAPKYKAQRSLVMLDLEIQALESAVEQIWEVARGFGLDPYPTNFEIVPAQVMYKVCPCAVPGR